MRFAVVQFGGSNCDRDTWHVLQEVLGWTLTLCGTRRAFPGLRRGGASGGFSYGDYLRAGAIAARTPVMQDIRRHVLDGKLVLGICNGAQMSAEAGFVEGTFAINAYPKFLCRPVNLRVETRVLALHLSVPGGGSDPAPHRPQGGAVHRPAGDDGCPQPGAPVAFRFCDEKGVVSEDANHNGSLESVTGVLGPFRNVLALMPHPNGRRRRSWDPRTAAGSSSP